jgi:hypothetical protein
MAFKLVNNNAEKTCAICGKIFARGKGVSTKVWEKRQCCCRNCSNYLRRKPIEKLARQTPHYLRRRIDTVKGEK